MKAELFISKMKVLIKKGESEFVLYQNVGPSLRGLLLGRINLIRMFVYKRVQSDF